MSGMKLSVAMFLAAPAVSAAAQESQPGIEEVLVSAMRRETASIDAPVTLSVYSAKDIAVRGLDRFEDLLKADPALTYTAGHTPIITSFYLRGIGNDANVANFDPEVGLFVDGVYRSRSGIATGSILDVERIEVIKGPQTTLFGRSTAAGAISVITRDPGKTFDGRISATYGRFNQRTLDAAIGGPLGDKVGVRLAARYDETDGDHFDLVRNEYTNARDQISLRGKLSIEPTDDLKFKITAAHVHRTDRCCSLDVVYGPTSRYLLSVFAPDAPIDEDLTNHVSTQNIEHRIRYDATDVTLDGSVAFGGATLTSQTSYSHYQNLAPTDGDLTILDVLRVTQRGDESRDFAQELRIASDPGGRFDWILGATYGTQHFRRDNADQPTFILGEIGALLIPGAIPLEEGFFHVRDKLHYSSLFGQLETAIGAHLRGSVAVRWFDEKKETQIFARAGNPGGFMEVFLRPDLVDGKVIDTRTRRVNWESRLRYELTPNAQAYASIAKGTKGRGVNDGWGKIDDSLRVFHPETVHAYEAGLKSRWLDNRLSVDAAVFRMNYRNLQVASFLARDFLVTNAEKAHVTGAEVELHMRPTKALALDVAVQRLDAVYDTFRNGQCYPGRAKDNLVLSTCDLSGNHLTYSSPWIVNLGGAYTVELANWQVTARGDWSWRDRFQSSANQDPRTRQPSYDILNVRLTASRGSIELILWARNLFDTHSVIYSAPQTFFGDEPNGGIQATLVERRSYGGTVAYRF